MHINQSAHARLITVPTRTGTQKDAGEYFLICAHMCAYVCICVHMCAYVCISAHMYAYMCAHMNMCAKLLVCVHMCECMLHTCTKQLIHAAMVQTIDHRPLHKHMHLNLCMLHSCKQAVKELKHMQFKLYML